MKSRKLSKSTKIFLLTSGLVISATAATAFAILLTDNKKVEIRYLFENPKFDNKDIYSAIIDIMNQINNQVIKTQNEKLNDKTH